jgi:hypothetical protein
MKVADIIEEQSNQSKIDPISPDENGIYHLVANDEHIIMLENSLDEVGFFMYSVIGEINEQETQILYEILADTLFDETNHTSISIDRDTSSLVLWQYFYNETTSFAIYQQELENFISVFEYWSNKASKYLLPEQHINSLKKQRLSLAPDQKMNIFLT